jgi:hypothetical protein
MAKSTIEKAAGFNPIATLHELGFRSETAYAAGFASIILSILAWLVSRGKKDERAQSDRWGIFIGHWAPTFFAIGIALKHEE